MSAALDMTMQEVVDDALAHAGQRTVLEFACDIAERTARRYAKHRPMADCTDYLDAIEKRREGEHTTPAGPGGTLAQMMMHLQYVGTKDGEHVVYLCQYAAEVEVDLAGVWNLRRSINHVPEYRWAMSDFRCWLWRRVHPIRKPKPAPYTRPSNYIPGVHMKRH